MKTQDQMEFAARLQLNSSESNPCRIAKNGALLMRYAKQLHDVYTRQCNGYQIKVHTFNSATGSSEWNWSEDAKVLEKDERKEITLQSKITVLLAEINPSLVPIFQTDPRGMPVRIVHASEAIEAERTRSLGFYIPIS